MKKNYPIVFFIFIAFSAARAQDKKLMLSGFSEVRMETRFGEPPEKTQLDSVEAHNSDLEEFEDNTRLFLPALNLNFLSELSDKLIFQSELYFELDQGIRLELLRLFVDYRINPKFNLQVGKFLSPIGYLNRNQRFYGYLNNSIKPRDMVTEDNGFIPLFTTGLQAHGTFEISSTSSLMYMLAYGASRLSSSPEGDDILSLEFGEEITPGVSGLLEWTTFRDNSELAIGISGYTNPKIESIYLRNGSDFTEGVDPEVELKLKETGIAPYVRYNTNRFQFLGEYHSIKFEDEESTSGKSEYTYSAASLELLYKTKIAEKPFGPYVRYDFRTVDGDHPYYGLEGTEQIHKNFVADQSELVIGFVWDLFPTNRFKIEYGANFKGAEPASILAVSTAFAF